MEYKVECNELIAEAEDYDAVNERRTFNSTIIRSCVPVSTTTDNQTNEDSENFTITLSSPTLSQPTLTLSPISVSINIGEFNRN